MRLRASLGNSGSFTLVRDDSEEKAPKVSLIFGLLSHDLRFKLTCYGKSKGKRKRARYRALLKKKQIVATSFKPITQVPSDPFPNWPSKPSSPRSPERSPVPDPGTTNHGFVYAGRIYVARSRIWRQHECSNRETARR